MEYLDTDALLKELNEDIAQTKEQLKIIEELESKHKTLNERMYKTNLPMTKDDVLKKMIKHVCIEKGECDTQEFSEVYALLKQIDADLEEKKFTEVHFSRYEIVKLLENAKQYVEEVA